MAKTKTLGREALGQRKFRTCEHPVPEWEGAVLLRRISEAELMDLQETARKITRNGKDGDVGTNPREMSRFRRSLVYTCWVDENGNQVLTDLADMDALAKEEFAIIDGIANAAAKHNGLTEDAQQAEKKD